MTKEHPGFGKDLLSLGAIRSKLDTSGGKRYWRSLEEVADTPAFQEFLHREFPSQASEWLDPAGRRTFLKLMGASLALAGLNACTRQPAEKVLPYVRQPEELVPGKPLFFATTMSCAGSSTGLLVESHEGRPTKIEGNPDHPASLGAADATMQAAILGLYDPDRSQTVTFLGDVSTWSAFLGALSLALQIQEKKRGAGFRLLTGSVTSPSEAALIQELLAKYPEARWHQYEPAGRDNSLSGAQLAFGEFVDSVYRVDQAEVILSIDADFLSSGPGSLRYTREFTERRSLEPNAERVNRLYVVESAPSITGAKADHRLALRPSDIEAFTRALAAAIGVQPTHAEEEVVQAPNPEWITALAKDLVQHRGASLVIPGVYQPPQIHALTHAINHALGNDGKTVIYTDPVEARPLDGLSSLRELVEEMQAGKVEVLVILGGNPVYDAPVDFGFADHLDKVPFRARLGPYNDETSELCHWHIPETHFLESWGDARTFDGTASIVQPLISPLYNGRSALEFIAALLNQPERTSYDIVRGYWKRHWRGSGQASDPKPPSGPQSPRSPSAAPADPEAFERFWRKSVHDGLMANSASSPRPVMPRGVNVNPEAFSSSPRQRISPSEASSFAAPETLSIGATAPGFQIVFRPDPYVFDGRFANNGWLQELPRPMTSLTWGNAALLSPATAESQGFRNEEVIELQYQGRAVRAPVWIVPGHADGTVTLYLGFGRTRAGRVGTGAGFSAYALRTSAAPWAGVGLQLRRTGIQEELAGTHLHHSVEGRDLIRAGSVEEFVRHPSLAPENEHETEGDTSLFPRYPNEGHAWGMAIDLNRCIGCNACMVACQSENNIPIVGKEQVIRGREMHWIRVDRYHIGGLDNPKTYFQPVPCMQCENAPCEVVCPVAATTHSAEGLNDQVYNRCVGTRYCANNCPYKVRRFNYLLYNDWDTTSLKMMRNPDVTVRSRGVMEKCTYCVQRINRNKIEAEKQNRPLRDGEIVTACQQTCPAEAIVFGDIQDPESRVSKLKALARNYSLLGDLNTRPRTTYLGAVRNPNPEILKLEERA